MLRLLTLFCFFCFLSLPFAAFATPDISVIIDGQTYLCSGSGNGSSPCDGKVRGFEAILEACLKSYTGAYCMAEYWPKFKRNNPQCILDGTPACLDACMKSYTGAYCAAECQ